MKTPDLIRKGHLVTIRRNRRTAPAEAIVVRVATGRNGYVRADLIQTGARPASWWARVRGGEYEAAPLIKFIRDEAGSPLHREAEDMYLNGTAYLREKREAERAFQVDRLKRMRLSPGSTVFVRYRGGPQAETVQSVDGNRLRVTTYRENRGSSPRTFDVAHLFTDAVPWELYREE